MCNAMLKCSMHSLPAELLLLQVIAVMDAMPSASLKPDTENLDAVLEKNKTYRTTYMFR